MLNAIALLLCCQLAGEALVRLLGLPIPGPVVGMLLLLGGLIWRRRSSHELDQTADTLLRYLALLFVPAGVGVMVYLKVLSEAWVVLLITLAASTVITLLVTGWLMQWLLKRGKHIE
jgi:holin-like protein